MGTGALAFEQLDHPLPTPGETRTASGVPGPEYWLQRSDYVIRLELDDEKQQIVGSEEITYKNLSPHTLKYLWVQFDQNRFRPDSDDMLMARAPDFEKFSYRALSRLLTRRDFDGGFQISKVADGTEPAPPLAAGPNRQETGVRGDATGGCKEPVDACLG